MDDQRITAILSELRAASITPEAATQNMIAIFADHECTLTSLNLAVNEIGDAGTRALAEALKNPGCMLTSLNLRWNKIGSEGAQALAEALQTNRTLTSLNLSRNYISHVGVKALAKTLGINKTLTSLNLWHNHIDNKGAIVLAEALKDPGCTLTSLCLLGNDIGPKGGKAIAEALKTNSTLTYLYLDNNDIGDEAKTDLFNVTLTWAQKGRLIEINGVFSEDQKQTIQEAYDAAILASYQRLALATALLTSSSAISSLSLDVLELITTAHTNPSIPVQPDLIEQYSTEKSTAHEASDILESTAHEASDTLESTQKMSLAKQCLFNMSLGLAVSAFTAHLLDLTFDTATLLSPPFAMSLAVGTFVTAIAFFATSSCITVCRPNTPTVSSYDETQSSAFSAGHTALGDPSDLQATPNTADNAQLASRSPRS